jgi:putative flippase GtrA
MSPRQSLVRWLKFNAVGAGGVCVQLATLALLTSVLGANYLLATALAVEAAIVHNFFWHERFTWSDRKWSDLKSVRGPRFLKFNLITGVTSILGNVLLMKFLVGVASLPYLVANLLSIAACSLLNFVLADRIVFLATRSEIAVEGQRDT